MGQNSGQESQMGSRLVMAEAMQHKEALKKKCESSGDEGEKEKDNRWSVNIPITKVSNEDKEATEEKRWSVNIPIIRDEKITESGISKNDDVNIPSIEKEPAASSDTKKGKKLKDKLEGSLTKGGIISREMRKVEYEEPKPPNVQAEISLSKEIEGTQEMKENMIDSQTESKSSVEQNSENKRKVSGTDGGAKQLRKLLLESKEDDEVNLSKRTETAQVGTLYLTIHKAKNLESKDLIGKSDPYIIVKYGETKLVSAKKSNTNNPEWNFEVDVKVHQNHPENITLEVMDKDKVGKDDTLGSTSVSVSDILKLQRIDNQWVKLAESKEGELQYTAVFSPIQDEVAKPHTIETSHTFTAPNSNEKLMEVSHSIQLPEGFVIESLDSTQTVSYETVKEGSAPAEEPGVREVITFDKDKEESSIKREIVIDHLHDTTPNMETENKKTTFTLPYIKRETKEALYKDCNKDKSRESSVIEEDHDHDEECGTDDILHVRVHKARNLENKDAIGKSDPYIKIRFGCDEVRSKTINNDLDPEWQFHTKYHIDRTSSKMIDIQIFDDDFGKDEPLGEVNLDVSHIKKRKQILKQWLPLAGCKSGEIQVSTQYVKSGDKIPFGIEDEKNIDETEARQTKTVKESMKEEQLPTGKLYIKVRRAKNLKKKKLGNPDPYVTLRRNGKIQRSATVKNNTNPEWDFSAEYLTFGQHGTTIIEVFDKDVGRDDFLGRLEVLDEDIIREMTVINKWVPLQKVKTGDIQISAQYTQDPQEMEDLSTFEREQEAVEATENLRREQEALCQYVPEELLAGLPPEFADMLKGEVGKACEILIKKEDVKEEKRDKSQNPDKLDSPSDLNEILGMVDGLDESTSKYIFEQLQHIFKEIEEEKKEESLKSFKDELLQMQIEQNQLIPEPPTELLKSLPEDIAQQMKDAMKSAYREMAHRDSKDQFTETSHQAGLQETTTSVKEDIATTRSESQVISEEVNPIPSLPEELLKNLPPEMVEALKTNFESSMRDIARQEVEKSLVKEKLTIHTNGKQGNQDDTEPCDEKCDNNYVEEEEDVSLPPTPAVSNPWSEIAARPERPHGPTPDKSEEHERKVSGPFSSTARRELFSEDRESSSVSPEVHNVALATVTKVINEAQEKVRNISNQETKFNETEIQVVRTTTTEEDRYVRKDLTLDYSEHIVHVLVHKARNLENKDILGESDPFIQIKLGEDVTRSDTVQNNLNPEWQFHTKFPLKETSPKELEITILDDDYGKTELIGEIKLNIEDMKREGSVLRQWIPLTSCASGEIQISAQIFKSGEEQIFDLSSHGPESETEETKKGEVKEMIEDFLKSENSEANSESTDVLKKKQDEVKAMIEEFLDSDDSEGEQSKNENETHTEKDITGTDKVRGNDQPETKEVEEETTIPVTKDQSKKTENHEGAKGLRKSLNEISSTVEQTTDGMTKKQATPTKEINTSYVGNLKISITKAKDLEKKDILQKADPYVIVRLGSQTSKSEKVKNTLEPVE